MAAFVIFVAELIDFDGKPSTEIILTDDLKRWTDSVELGTFPSPGFDIGLPDRAMPVG